MFSRYGMMPAAAMAIRGRLAGVSQALRPTSDDVVFGVGLGAGALTIAALIVAAGGAASPAALMLAALPVEAFLARRSRNAAVAGAIAAALTVALAFAASIAWPEIFGVARGWHWLVPLSYGAAVALRVKADRSLWPAAVERRAPVLHIAPVDAVLLRFGESGDVVDATDTTRSVLNLAPDLLCGSGLFDRIHVGDRVAYLCALAEMRSGAAGRRIELRLRLPSAASSDGPDNFQPFAVDFCASADGVLAMLRGNRDMVELREAIRDARDRNDGTELAKGRFLAAVSHELRTPLNAIIGFSEILLHELFGGFKDARQREYTALIKESGHHLLAVVNSILDVSKIESGTYAIQTEPFAFGEAAEMCRSMMSLQAQRKEIDLRMQISPSLGDLVADRRAVQQILINLVANSIKFTPETGSVVIGAQRVGSRLHFWVADTGIGIAEDDLDRIGRPFTQIRNDYTRQFEGTGLGLSLVKGLVSLHEGTMSIESAPGEGTKVAISLPLAGPGRSEDPDGMLELAVHKGGDYGALRKTA